jgi:hypothetical protein
LDSKIGKYVVLSLLLVLSLPLQSVFATHGVTVSVGANGVGSKHISQGDYVGLLGKWHLKSCPLPVVVEWTVTDPNGVTHSYYYTISGSVPVSDAYAAYPNTYFSNSPSTDILGKYFVTFSVSEDSGQTCGEAKTAFTVK